MTVLGPDHPFWPAMDKRVDSRVGRRITGTTQAQVLSVGSGPNAGQIKVRDPAGGTGRDLFYPQTDPSYVPEAGEWMWALEKEGGLLLLSPTGQVTLTEVEWTDVLNKPVTFPSTWATVSGKPTSFPSTWTDVSGKPTTFAPDNHSFWSTKHTDVTSTDTPANGDVVTYDGSTSKWKASPPTGSAGAPDYIGSETLITANSDFTWTHSLGSRPRIINAYRRIATGSTLYIPLPAGPSASSGSGSIVTLVESVTTSQITIANKDTVNWYCGVELWS